jgi:hypothetical protein
VEEANGEVDPVRWMMVVLAQIMCMDMKNSQGYTMEEGARGGEGDF